MKLREILLESDTEWIEVVSLSAALFFGIRVLFPQLVSVEDIRAEQLTGAVPRMAWSIVFLALTILHVAALNRGNHRLRRVATFAGMSLWLAAGGAAWYIGASGFSVYFALALCLGWSHIRLRVFGG